jgi:hypothetical protein
MATAHQIRDLIAQTTTGTARPLAPREVRDEVCRYAGRRRRKGAGLVGVGVSGNPDCSGIATAPPQ